LKNSNDWYGTCEFSPWHTNPKYTKAITIAKPEMLHPIRAARTPERAVTAKSKPFTARTTNWSSFVQARRRAVTMLIDQRRRSRA
jgi:hypothetical protein